MTTELKPCPFCGSTDIYCAVPRSGTGGAALFFPAIQCNTCTAGFNSTCNAIERWNTRQETPLQKAAPTMLVALKEMLFAYQNKDADCPHDFEIKALAMAKEAIALAAWNTRAATPMQKGLEAGNVALMDELKKAIAEWISKTETPLQKAAPAMLELLVALQILYGRAFTPETRAVIEKVIALAEQAEPPTAAPGATIKDILEERGLSEKELADLTGCTQEHIRLLIRGGPIDEEMAQKLEKALGGSARFWMKREAHYTALAEQTAPRTNDLTGYVEQTKSKEEK